MTIEATGIDLRVLARAPQAEDGVLHLRVVTLADGVDQFAEAGYRDDTTQVRENLVR
jgi:hypothetical protein